MWLFALVFRDLIRAQLVGGPLHSSLRQQAAPGWALLNAKYPFEHSQPTEAGADHGLAIPLHREDIVGVRLGPHEVAVGAHTMSRRHGLAAGRSASAWRLGE